MTPSPRPAWRKRLLVAGVVVAGLALIVSATPLWLTGPRLGRLVEQRLPRTRGHVHVGGGSWSWATVWALVRGQPAPLLFDDVSLTDPDGVLVLRARRVSGALLRGHAPDGLTIQDLRVERGAWVMAETKDRRGIGFLRALELVPASPRTAPAGQTEAPEQGGFRYLHVLGAELVDLDVDFALPGWGLSLRQVHGHGTLALERKDGGPNAFTFAVLDADPRAGGRVSVLDGKWRATLPFSSARITRIAATAEAPDTIALDASQIVTGHSTTALHGAFTGVLPAPGPARKSGIDLAVTMENATDAMQAVVAMRGWTRLKLAGDGATVAMSFAGPLGEPRLDVRALGFDVRYGDAFARAFGFHLDAQLATRQVHLRELGFTSPAGGRLLAKAHLDYGRAAGTVALAHFDAAPYLPPGLRSLAAGTLDGDVEGRVDLDEGTASLNGVALTIVRPPGAAGPCTVRITTARRKGPPEPRGITVLRLGNARLEDGTLALPRITGQLAGGQVTAAGSLTLWDPRRRDWLPSPAFDVSLDVSRLTVERLLGAPLATGQVSFRARARGTFEALTLQARVSPGQRVRILGDDFTLPPAVALSLAAGAITLAPLTLSGAGGERLTARGSVTTDGRLALQARADDVALRPLIAWGTGLQAGDLPIDGRVAVELALAGEATAPAVTGTLAISGTRFRGLPLGEGSLALDTAPGGQLRLRGRVIDGVTLDGILRSGGRSGDRARARLTLARLRLQPFLAAVAERLPAGTTIDGELSGVIEAALSPDGKASLDARFSKVMVTARPRGTREPAGSTATGAVALESTGPVHVATQLATRTLRLEPARFSGQAGDVELSGEWRGETFTGRARGQVNAHALLSFLSPSLRETVTALDGALDVDVQLDGGKGAAPADATAVNGSLAIAAPLRVRLAALPFDVVAPSGRLSLASGGATLEKLVFNVGGATLGAAGRITPGSRGGLRAALELHGALDARLAEPLGQGYLRDARGQIRVRGRVDGPLDHLILRARLDVDGVAFTMMPGANRIGFAAGSVTVEGRAANRSLALSLANVDLRIGDGNQLMVGGDARDPGRLRLSQGGAGALDVDLPVQGHVRALATPVAIIDSAAFGVRLTGTPGRTLRLAGDVFIDAAHVPPSLRRPKKLAQAAPGDKARAMLNATRLDLRVRSKPQAVTVEVAHVPDLHAALDYHLGGTVGAPEVKGSVKPAGVYSAVLFFLARLLN